MSVEPLAALLQAERSSCFPCRRVQALELSQRRLLGEVDRLRARLLQERSTSLWAREQLRALQGALAGQVSLPSTSWCLSLSQQSPGKAGATAVGTSAGQAWARPRGHPGLSFPAVEWGLQPAAWGWASVWDRRGRGRALSPGRPM